MTGPTKGLFDFSRKKRASLIRRILKTQEWGKYDGDEPRRGEL